ncbi:MAG: hypothetical protein V1801_02460 [Candidatus Falkowbacteria bacterium]
MKIKFSTKELFSYLSIFGELNAKTKLYIFKTSCRNNFRYLQSPNQNQVQLFKHILETNTIWDNAYLEEMNVKANIKLVCTSLNNINYLKKILETEKFLLQTNRFDKWKASIILNTWLVRNNLCPFLRYAFDQWYNISKDNAQLQIPSLIEFSTAYLYRLSGIKNKIITRGVYLADGAHNSLFLFKKNEIIKKIPKSIGAKHFINDQEIKVTKSLRESALKEYIPRLISYNKTTKVITREYIRGKTGHELLKFNFFNNIKAIEDLKRFFKLYKKTRNKLKINLDIHPGNFVWSKGKKKWFLVDTGPIPLIGSKYFPLSSFERYFRKIWIERHKRMKEAPIRSVDLNL